MGGPGDVPKVPRSPTKLGVIGHRRDNHLGVHIEAVGHRSALRPLEHVDDLGLGELGLEPVEAQGVPPGPEEEAGMPVLVRFCLRVDDRSVLTEHAYKYPMEGAVALSLEHVDIDVLVATHRLPQLHGVEHNEVPRRGSVRQVYALLLPIEHLAA